MKMDQVDPNSTTAFIPILMMLIVAIGFAIFTLVGSHFLGTRIDSKAKLGPYECGITPVGSARDRFAVRFYLVAMLFIVFDIEIVFLYPWAVVYRSLGWFGFWEMVAFLGVLCLGLGYVWRKGGLEWE